MPKNIDEILREVYEEKTKKFVKDTYLTFQKVEQRGGLFITDFLTPQEQHYFQEIGYLFKNLFTRLEGGVPLSERKRGFITDNRDILEYLDLEKYFLGLEINFNEKVSISNIKEKLIQKGIDEGKIGDIWIIGNKMQMVCGKEVEEDIEKIFKELNFGYCFVPLNALVPPKGAKILKTTEASLRLDAIASFAFNISRSRMQELIKNSAVMVNNKTINYPHYELKEEDLVFVKNLGYFKVKALKETKRGRYSIEIERH